MLTAGPYCWSGPGDLQDRYDCAVIDRRWDLVARYGRELEAARRAAGDEQPEDPDTCAPRDVAEEDAC